MILESLKIRKVFLPEYICPVVFEIVQKCNVDYETYPLNENLSPLYLPQLKDNEYFLYVNFWGIQEIMSRNLIKHFGKRLILDLTQAFFFQPPEEIIAFNSVRKFVGTPDGSFLFGGFTLDLPQQESAPYCQHLLMRAEGETEKGFPCFQENSRKMDSWIPQRMSQLTEKILGSISLEKIKYNRQRNFKIIASMLNGCNQFSFPDLTENCVPLCYPFLCEMGDGLKNYLIQHRIYIPTYWNGIENYITPSSNVQYWTHNMVCLPIDQNYTKEQIEFVAKTILNYFKENK